MRFKTKILLIFILLLSSCKVGPNYEKPKIDLPDKFKEAGVEWEVFILNPNTKVQDWWKIFNDPELNKLEEKLTKNNFTIKAAESGYKQALSIVEISRAAYLPNIAATSSILRGKNSVDSKKDTISRSLMLESSWELDFWGNIGRSIESAKAASDLAKSNYDAAILSAQTSLAQYYFELRMLDNDQKLLDEIVEANKNTLQYTKKRYKSGVAGDQQVAQVSQQLEMAKNQAISNKINRSQYEHAIAVLVGDIASNFTLPAKVSPYPKISVPMSLPSTILKRRPDIISSERQAAIASASIGITKSAFFPILSIPASANYEGIPSKKLPHIDQLLKLPTLIWSLGPELALNLTNLATYKEKMKSVREAYNAAIDTYRQTVLSAFADVEDNLVSLNILNQEVEILKTASRHAKKNLDITQNQYKSGIIDKSQVYAAQITYLTAEKTLNDTEGLRMTSSVGLIKALGGVWKN